MKIYLVGGAVRDKLMGVEPKDLDYVVVGSTPEEMLARGFKQVGSDFPVFLNPDTGEEYALARTEKSNGTSYQAFECDFGPEVTLEEDLSRRDLTINAMAEDNETGKIIDPFNGQQDIKDRVLRHVSDAFTEDPTRVLRIVKFMCRFGWEWDCAEETKILVLDMAAKGLNLTAERVWKELSQCLDSKHSQLLIPMLHQLNIFPAIDAMVECPQDPEHHPEGCVATHTMLTMQYATRFSDPMVMFAALCHDFGKPINLAERGNFHGHEDTGILVIEQFCARWKVPTKYRELASMTSKYHTKVHSIMGRGDNKATKPNSIMRLFSETNALVKPERFNQMLQVCEADANGRGLAEVEYLQAPYLRKCLQAVKDVDNKHVTTLAICQGKTGPEIGEALRVARISAIRKHINSLA